MKELIDMLIPGPPHFKQLEWYDEPHHHSLPVQAEPPNVFSAKLIFGIDLRDGDTIVARLRKETIGATGSNLPTLLYHGKRHPQELCEAELRFVKMKEPFRCLYAIGSDGGEGNQAFPGLMHRYISACLQYKQKSRLDDDDNSLFREFLGHLGCVVSRQEGASPGTAEVRTSASPLCGWPWPFFNWISC